jgi:hypothetical protein
LLYPSVEEFPNILKRIKVGIFWHSLGKPICGILVYYFIGLICLIGIMKEGD